MPEEEKPAEPQRPRLYKIAKESVESTTASAGEENPEPAPES